MTAFDASLLPASATLDAAGRVAIAGVDLASLAERFGTPLYVYDEADIRARCRAYRSAFGDGVAYASKAFLCVAMARLVHEEGLHLDVASGGELYVARAAGFPPDRIVFHGKRGELRQRYREGQEDQLSAVGLVVNVIVLWNTVYMDAALNQLRTGGFDVRDDDISRLSPLGFDHINMLGRYAFTLPDTVARGELRPLRDPTLAVDDDG